MESPTGTPGGGGGRGGGRGGARGARINPATVNLGRGMPAPSAPGPKWGGSPFVAIPRPNANPGTGGGMLGGVSGPANIGSGYGGARGGGGAPLGTALDLSRMFGGGPSACARRGSAHESQEIPPTATALAPRRAPPAGPQAAQPGPMIQPPESIDPSISGNWQRMQQPRTPADYGDQSWLYGNQPPM